MSLGLTMGAPAFAEQDYTIAASGGDITGAKLQSDLATGNFTILSSSGSTAGTGDINVNDQVTWSANTLTLTAANNININAFFQVSGAGGLILNPATTNGGDNAVPGGTVIIGSTGALTLGGSGLLSLSAGIVNNGALTFQRDVNTTYAGVISGAGDLDQSRSGTLTLTGTNTYTGATTIDSGGTLALAGTGSVAASSGVTLADGTLDISGTTSGTTITSLNGFGTVVLGAQTLVLSNASGNISGEISGTGGLTLAGGTETLAGANTYTGVTTIDSGGMLALFGAGSVAASSGVTVNNNGTFDISGVPSDSSIASLSGNGSVVLGVNTLTLSNAAGTFDGVISGTGGLTLVGGTETLGGTNTYTGTTTINGGTLVVSSDANLGSGGGLTFNGGTLENTAAFTTNRAITLGANGGTLQTDAALTAGVISGNGGLTKTGTGTLTLLGANNYLGGTTINGGTLAIGPGGSLAATGAVTLANASGVSFDISNAGNQTIGSLGGGGTTGGTVALGANTLTLKAGQAGYFFGTIEGSGGLTLEGGLEVLGGPNTYTGVTTIDNGGTLAISGNGSVAVSSGVIVNSGGTFATGGTTIKALSGNGTLAIQNSGTLTLSNATGTFGGVIYGSGGLTLAGGTETLTGVNTYTGVTTIDTGGTVKLTGGGSLSSSSGVTDNGTFDVSGVTGGATGIASLSGNGTVTLGANTLTLSNASGSFGGVIGGSGGLMLAGGTQTLAGANTYTGGTTIAAGATLQIGDGNGNGSIVGNVVDDGTLAFDVGSASSNGYSTLAYGGDISGSGVLRTINTSVAVGNEGILFLNGQNSFTGGAEIGGTASGETGTIAVHATNVNALGTGAVTVNGPGELGISGSGNTDVFGNTLNSTGYVNFQNLTLGSQAITNGPGFAFMDFSTGSSAGSAAITNVGFLSFDNNASAGTATIQNSGSLDFGGTSTAAGATIQNTGDVGIDTTYSGNLAIGSLSGSGTVHLGSGTLVLGGLNRDDTISGAISDGLLTSGGSLAKTGSGTLTLDGQDTYTGGTEVQQGKLIVGSVAGNGATVAGDVNVDSGATLGGHGTIGGNVDVAAGAHLAPGNSIGTLTVAGNLTAAQGSFLDYEFGAPGASFQAFGAGDSVHVGGNLELDGATLNVTDAGGMGPGLYNLFTWGGTLTETNGGFALNNPTGQTLQVQTLTAQKQINLIDSTGLTLNFWNANGAANATQMGGGSGTWSATSQVWTDATGSVTAAMQPQPGFAIFGGTPGTVTVDGGAGSVTATGMQFAVDGYTVSGGTLTLVGSGGTAPIVRVGNGSAAGAGMTATLGNVIAGSDGLVKSDLGTLVLAGANTFTGGVAINCGTLSVASDANLGDAGNALTLNGGTLKVTGTTFTSTARGITLGSSGGFDIDAAGNTFTLAQALSGAGPLAKTGSGTLALTGANTFTGGTTVSAGTLQIGNGGTSGSLAGNVIDNAALVFNRSDAVNFVGAISGTGSLNQQGSGSLTLNADSSAFKGITNVSNGTLVVGDDAHAGASLGGNVMVASGATLGGIGTVGGLDVFGTLSPGNSIGTLHVAGNAVFEAGSTFQVEADSTGHSDQLAATGAVTIKGGNTLVIAQSGNWAPRTDYTIITAGGGVSGQFAGVSDNLAFLDPVLSYQANAVQLSLERNDISFNTVATTPNENGVAGGAGGLGWNSPLYTALVLLDAPTAQAAFNQLSGEFHASEQTARINDSRYVREAMDQRLRAGDADPEAAKQGDTQLTAWAHAWGHWGTTDSDGNAGRLADNGDGLLIGADMPVGTQARVGVTGGASRNSLSVGSRASWGRLTSQWLGAFGGFEQGAFALRGGIAYAWDQVPTNRVVNFPGFSDRLSGNAAGNTLTGFVEGAWTFKLMQGSVAPLVNLAHTRVETDASTEAGGAAALHVSGGSTNTSFSTVGARGSWQLAGSLDLHGELGWQHAFGNTTPARTLQFAAGGTAFTEYGVPIAKNAGLGKVGLGWHAGRVRIDADYEGLFGSGVQDQAAKLSVGVAF